MTDYIARPKDTSTDVAVAATYRSGQPLDDLRMVAHRADPGAQVVEVPQWGVLLVRHERTPDHGPTYMDYDVVEDGQMLIWSQRTWTLYVDDVAGFEREWMPRRG